MITRVFFFVAIVLIALKFSLINEAHAEGGMIPFDSPTGEIGGRGHWYALRTMKGEDYWKDTPVTSDIRDNEDGTYSIMGEPPVSVALVLHPDFYTNDEPWRHAIDWVRQAEQMFRNSGVPVRFIIEHIEVWDEMPNSTLGAYNLISYAAYQRDYNVDMVIALIDHKSGDPYCGVAGISGTVSVSGCGPVTLAHELGHNFGLRHAHAARDDGRKGFCMEPNPTVQECGKGTIMSYAGPNRVPLFAANGFTYKGAPLGSETHTAVEYLREISARKALRDEMNPWVAPPELSAKNVPNENYKIKPEGGIALCHKHN